jgi:malto-oligosyltrehalose trehalohydrolase
MNESRWLKRDETSRRVQYDAQWNDDIHHVLHTAATGECSGYYSDFVGDTEKLGRALAEGFAFQGELSSDLGIARGEASRHLPPTSFVSFIQNHDQIGNRAFGERLSAIASDCSLRCVAAIYLLAPQIPMLFMGEEWAAAEPFPFFCDFSAELADAVRSGRREEFARFPEFRDEAARARIPDPIATETFQSAKLQWSERNKGRHPSWMDWYRNVLRVRQTEIQPLLPRMRSGGSFRILAPGAVRVAWRLQDNAELVLVSNLSNTECAAPLGAGRLLWQEGVQEEHHAAPWSIRWSIAPASMPEADHANEERRGKP